MSGARIISFALVLVALSQGAAPARHVSVLVEHLQMEAAVATAVLSSADEAGMRDAVGRLEDGGEAALVEVGYIATVVGERATIESVLEWIYTSESDPPNVPQADLAAPLDELGARGWPSFEFEMRRVGMVLEIEVNAADGGVAELNVASEIVGVVDEREWGHGIFRIAIPEFDQRRLNTSVKVPIGGSRLLASHDLLGGNGGATVLTFLTVEVHGVESLKVIDDPFAEGAAEELLAARVATNLEMVEIDLALFRELVALDAGESPWSVLDPAIEDGSAALLGSVFQQSSSGKRVRSNTVHGLRYPTEFDPEEIKVVGNGEGAEPLVIKVPAPPSTMEARALGVTLESSMVGLPEQGDLVRGALSAKLVRYVKTRTYKGPSSLGPQPIFDRFEIRQAVVLESEADALLAAGTPRDSEKGCPRSGRVIVVVGRSSTVR